EESLDSRRGDVIAAGEYDNVLLAIGDDDVAIFVEDSDVAGVEPAIPDRLRRCLRIAPVAFHHAFAPDQDLAILSDIHLDPVERWTHRLQLDARGRVGADDRRGFGLAIALEQTDAQGQEEHANLVVERGAAGDHGLEPSAKAGPKPAPHGQVTNDI